MGVHRGSLASHVIKSDDVIATSEAEGTVISWRLIGSPKISFSLRPELRVNLHPVSIESQP